MENVLDCFGKFSENVSTNVSSFFVRHCCFPFLCALGIFLFIIDTLFDYS